MHTCDSKTDISEEFSVFLQNMLQIGKRCALLFCGSAFELPLQYVTSFATDLDIMFIPTDCCALPLHLSTPTNFQGRRFTVDTGDTHPGFARFDTIDGKRFHLRQMGVLKYHEKHGPAWAKSLNATIDENTDMIFGIARSSRFPGILRRLLELKLDKVFAIHCPCWPTEAGDWKTRERTNGWPPLEIIDKIVASGCYFVAKPHHSSPNDDTQWRFSFSQAELILIHSWTDVQKYIYHILRLIKSEVVKACGGSDETVLCTYFFKTLMFWECERKPKDFWEDGNVEKSVNELLCIMIEWFVDGCCPNYFIPKCNMISASTERVDFSKEIQLLLNYTIMDITKITATWERAYPPHIVATFDVAISEEMLLYNALFQLRDNMLNPLNPKIKPKIFGKLTRKNSLLWHKVNDLYRGIMAHLRLISECCPITRGNLEQEALGYYLKSQQEVRNLGPLRVFSIGDSFYEILERFNGDVNNESKSKSGEKSTNHHSNQLAESHFSDICQRYTQNFHVQNCDRRFVRCYSRKEEAEDDLAKTVRPITVNDSLNAYVKNLSQYLLALGFTCRITATRVIGSAYLANFYYTTLQDYKKTHEVCEAVLNFRQGDAKSGRFYMTFSERAFPLFITNKLSAIFDEHFRIVLGLITLHRFIVDSLPDNSTVLIRICPAQLLKYLSIQCRRWAGVDDPVVNGYFKCSHASHNRYTYEPLSELFMAAVLRASRIKT